MKDLLAATNEDPALVKLRDFAETTWPDDKQDVPEEICPYWMCREEITFKTVSCFAARR